jgi:hypothetical protein
MNRAGSPKGGRKETAAKGPSKSSVESKAAKPAAKTVKGALKRVQNEAASRGQEAAKRLNQSLNQATKAAGGLAKKIAKSVTSITKKSVEKVEKAAKKTVRPAKPAPKAPAKKAANAQAAAKAPAKPAAVKRGNEAAGKRMNQPAAKAKTEKSPKAKTAEAPKAVPAAKPKPVARKLRPKAFGELETARGFGFPEETPELPEAYGEDRLVLMTKDPEYLFAYWEITPERRALAERAKHEREEYREALRLTWTSADLLEDSFVLLPVSLDAKRWYLRVPFSGLSYHIEIGWLGEQGHFISVLGSSNPSDAPESWAKTRKRLLESDAAALEYSVRMTHPLGSSESARPAPGSKKKVPLPDYEGPGAQSSSDAAVKIPAAPNGKRS